MTTLKEKKRVLNLISEIPNQQLQKLINSGLLADMLIANTDVVDKDKFRKIIGLSYSITVNYNLTLKEMIKRGQYDTANSAIYRDKIKKHQSQKEVTVELVHFNVPIHYDGEVIKKLLEKGLRPINISELLAFGAKYPKEQLNFPIIAVGSSFLGMPPGLNSYVNETRDLDIRFRKIRALCLFIPHDEWTTNFRFAATAIKNSSD